MFNSHSKKLTHGVNYLNDINIGDNIEGVDLSGGYLQMIDLLPSDKQTAGALSPSGVHERSIVWLKK